MKPSNHLTFDNAKDITELSAGEIAQNIRRGDISAHDVIEAHIQRIEAVNPYLNAVVMPRFEQALMEADVADEAQARGEPLGPLHGVPITIKDQFMVSGLPTTWGLPSRITNIANADGPLIKRLRQAGAIILGKTNVPELLAYHESDNPLFGRTNNPWKLDRTSGGSSGGEASIIAAGGSPLGLGADIGGSIRIPAHFCGLCGLKPTSGRLTNLDSPSQLFPLGQEIILAGPGPIARRVADLSLTMQLLTASGLEKLDPTIAPVPWLKPSKVELNKLRVGMYVNDGFWSTSPALRRAVFEAAKALQSLGVIVEEWNPPDIQLAMHIFSGALSADGGAYIRRIIGKDPYDFRIKGFLQMTALPNWIRPSLVALAKLLGQRGFADLLLNLHTYSTSGYMQLVEERTKYRAQFMQNLNAGFFDAILCPPHALPALTHGSSYELNSAGSYSMLYNLLGMPAGTVPITRVHPDEESDRRPGIDVINRTAYQVEMGSAGLPVGVQVIASHWREDIVIALMEALEAYFCEQKDYPLHPTISEAFQSKQSPHADLSS